jgi:hypothetical protein
MRSLWRRPRSAREGHIVEALPITQLLDILRKHGVEAKGS